MDYIPVHDFNYSIQKMIDIQNKLRSGIKVTSLTHQPKYISGVDVFYHNNEALAVIVTIDFTTLTLKEVTYAIDKVDFKYRAGFLAFRELPIFLKAWSNLVIRPNIVFFDGYGIVHPRRVGLATHASFFINTPTIGVAKNRFVGNYTNPINERGSYTYITDKEEILGASLRTKPNSKPIYISVGNFITLKEVITYTLDLTRNSLRIPLVTYLADYYGRKILHTKY